MKHPSPPSLAHWLICKLAALSPVLATPVTHYWGGYMKKEITESSSLEKTKPNQTTTEWTFLT